MSQHSHDNPEQYYQESIHKRPSTDAYREEQREEREDEEDDDEAESAERDRKILIRGVKMKKMKCEDNKFHKGNGTDKKHYWITPKELLKKLTDRFGFNFDACPFPKPADFDGLTNEWGSATYVNPHFGSIMHNGKKKGATAWARKAIEESKKGKLVVMVYPIDKWVLMMIAAGAKIENLGDVKWEAIEDGSAGKGTGRHIAAFILGEAKQ